MARQSKRSVAAPNEATIHQPAVSPTQHSNLPLIEVTESWLLDAIMSDPAAGRTIALRLSERVAVVTPGQIDALFARLRKLNHVPRMLEE